jgi:hypothetical protein
MTITEWVETPIAQFAPVVWIAFAVALLYSILGFYNWTGMLAKWHHDDCRYDIKFLKTSIKLTILWTIFFVTNYFLGVISA